MPQINRRYNQILKARIQEPRRFIQVLVGPRQVGKTTLVKQVLAELNIPGMYTTADNIVNTDSDWLATQWDTARNNQQKNPNQPYLLIIDEIQKISNWSETVKRCWDSDTEKNPQIRVILLGSSRLLVQEGLTESLAGRFEKIYIPHWSYTEMKEAFGFTLDQYHWFGGYPGAADLIEDENRWKSYVLDALIEPAVSKDILMLTRIDKPSLLRRTFELGCGYSGQILSYNKLLGQLSDAGNTTTLSHYIKLLDMAGLLAGLEKYSGAKSRSRGSSPKFQVQNNALLTSYSAYSFEEARADRTFWGRVVESSVGAYLYNASFDGRYGVQYWREGNEEVDFVLTKGKKIICLEVKSGISNRGINHKTFKKTNPQSKDLLVGGNGMPIEDLFDLNPANLF